jgi:hypothetical protein
MPAELTPPALDAAIRELLKGMDTSLTLTEVKAELMGHLITWREERESVGHR